MERSNQEVGIAIEKGKRIILYFLMDKHRFGFLEALRGALIDLTEDNLEIIVKDIIEKTLF